MPPQGQHVMSAQSTVMPHQALFHLEISDQKERVYVRPTEKTLFSKLQRVHEKPETSPHRQGCRHQHRDTSRLSCGVTKNTVKYGNVGLRVLINGKLLTQRAKN